ncbi:PREDICTED: luciferin 4-monooxygenase-like [Wasmannia auropunctata]|uniref:luciferin 4-monooxygenase-like n=1 Tax=Wasmannia auropunctata TaxID=64793 RepID=UPI0005F00D4B|nr:PREDICTED: luciferin 4-monooxygenase-like [Wasmannia auropunctata]
MVINKMCAMKYLYTRSGISAASLCKPRQHRIIAACQTNSKLHSIVEKKGKIYERRLEQPTPNVSMGEVILNKLRENGNHVYAIDGPTGNQITYRELLQKSVKFAKFLQKFGIKIGDRIGISTENRLNWLIPVYASYYIGATVAPYNPMYTEYELQHILNIAKPRIVFVSQHTENLFAKILPKLSWKMDLIELDDQPLTTNVCTLTNILNNEPDVDYMKYKPVAIDDPSRQPLVILCSSGTTGLPKGVALSHKNLITALTKFSKPEYMDTRSDDRILVLLPFYHVYGIGILLLGLLGNCILIIMRTFEPQLFLTLVQKYRITYLPVVPPIMTFLAKHPLVDSCDFRSVRELITGAAPVAKNIITTVKARIGVKSIRNGYGMTELLFTSLNERDDNDDEFENPSCGRFLPGFRSKVIDLETSQNHESITLVSSCFCFVEIRKESLSHRMRSKIELETLTEMMRQSKSSLKVEHRHIWKR